MFASAVRRLVTRSTAAVVTAVFGVAYAAPPASAVGPAVRGTTVPQAIRQTPRLHAALAAGTMPLVYVCDYTGEVLAYDATYTGGTPRSIWTPVETITGLRGPSGLAVDASGNLYVVESAANDIKVFAPGSVTPFKTLSGGAGATAQYIALDRNGNVYLSTSSNIIWVYRNGATTPSTALSDPSIAFVTALAVDRVGNIFVSYVRKIDDYYSVGAFPASISLGTGFFAPLPEFNGPIGTTPLGVAVDAGGDLLVGSFVSVGHESDRQINVYRPATSLPVSQFAFTDTLGLEHFALTGVTNPSIFVAPAKAGYVRMQSLTTGSLEIQYTLPLPFVTTSVAAYPAEPLGTW